MGAIGFVFCDQNHAVTQIRGARDGGSSKHAVWCKPDGLIETWLSLSSSLNFPLRFHQGGGKNPG